MYVSDERCSTCSYQKASVNQIMPLRHHPGTSTKNQCSGQALNVVLSALSATLFSQDIRPHVGAMRVFVAGVMNATFPFRRPRLSAGALRWHRVSFTSHSNLKRRSNHCCRVEMHLLHVAVVPSPAPNAQSNVRHTLLSLRESFCSAPKPGHVCR